MDSKYRRYLRQLCSRNNDGSFIYQFKSLEEDRKNIDPSILNELEDIMDLESYLREMNWN